MKTIIKQTTMVKAKRTKQLEKMVSIANEMFERNHFTADDMFNEHPYKELFWFVCEVLKENKCYHGFHPNSIRKYENETSFISLVHPKDKEIENCFIQIA